MWTKRNCYNTLHNSFVLWTACDVISLTVNDMCQSNRFIAMMMHPSIVKYKTLYQVSDHLSQVKNDHYRELRILVSFVCHNFITSIYNLITYEHVLLPPQCKSAFSVGTTFSTTSAFDFVAVRLKGFYG